MRKLRPLPTTISTLLFLFGFFLNSSGQQQQPTVNPSPAPSVTNVTSSRATASIADERYRIGPGDILEVLVYNQPQLSRPVLRVDGRGMIRMPLIEDEILAACKTETELAKELTTRYREYQKHPQVDVYVKEFNSQPVAVVGAVNSPGRFQLQRRVRLLEILTFAGGPSAAAGRTVQIVHAPGFPLVCEGEPEAADEVKEALSSYELSKTLRAEEPANPFLKPGDVVTVPDAEQIYVVGSVNRPTSIPLREPLTISRAILVAGGVARDAEANKIRIMRQNQVGGPKTELVVNLKEINKGTATDVMLQSNDVVEVPKQGGVSAVLRGLADAIVPTAMRLPLRVIY
jgi:polysaccharide biosynthesis/export protein